MAMGGPADPGSDARGHPSRTTRAPPEDRPEREDWNPRPRPAERTVARHRPFVTAPGTRRCRPASSRLRSLPVRCFGAGCSGGVGGGNGGGEPAAWKAGGRPSRRDAPSGPMAGATLDPARSPAAEMRDDRPAHRHRSDRAHLVPHPHPVLGRRLREPVGPAARVVGHDAAAAEPLDARVGARSIVAAPVASSVVAGTWRCCRTLSARESRCGVGRVGRPDDEARACPLPCDELVRRQRRPAPTRVAADLGGSRDGVARVG
jgi:hypothetical protein